jgi:hypothetical protein
VLVLVLEKWGWGGGVLAYRALSELHPCLRVGGAGGDPDFAPSSETPGGYAWQAALPDGSSIGC